MLKIVPQSMLAKIKASIEPLTNSTLLANINSSEQAEVESNLNLTKAVISLIDDEEGLLKVMKEFPVETLRMFLYFTKVSQEQLATVVFHYIKQPAIGKAMQYDEWWYGPYDSYKAIEEGVRTDKPFRNGLLRLFLEGHEWEALPFALERRRFNLRRRVNFWHNFSDTPEFFDEIAAQLKGRFSDSRNEHYVKYIVACLERVGMKADRDFDMNPCIEGTSGHYHLLVAPNIFVRITHQDTTSSQQDSTAKVFKDDCDAFSKRDGSVVRFVLCVGGGGWERRGKALDMMVKSAYFVFGLNDVGSFLEFINRVRTEAA